MDNERCKDCGHFLLHYTLGKNNLFAVYCGHCTYSRAKRKRPDEKACAYFTPGQPLDETFVTKEYLGKALLKKVLDMDLLPENEGRG